MVGTERPNGLLGCRSGFSLSQRRGTMRLLVVNNSTIESHDPTQRRFGFEIRHALAEDVPAAVDGLTWLFDHPGTAPPRWNRRTAKDRMMRLVGDTECAVLVAEAEGGAIVGIATVYCDIVSIRFGQRASLEDMAVHPTWRSRGIGRSLLGTALEWAREHHADYLFLESAINRVDAHRFYAREDGQLAAYSFRWPCGIAASKERR